MKILVLGLDCAAPELLFGYEDLPNIRRLMEVGCLRPARERHPADHGPRLDVHGDQPGPRLARRLRVPQPDRSLLRRPGDRHRRGRSPSRPSGTISPAKGSGRSSSACPPATPRARINGLSVSCFLTPIPTRTSSLILPSSRTRSASSSATTRSTSRASAPTTRPGSATQIFAMSRTQFQVVRHLIKTKEWDYFQFVDIGLDRVHHGFWKYHDPQHVLHEPDSPFKRDHPRLLPAPRRTRSARCWSCLSDDTIVLVVSDHGAQRLDGGFCVNEWLVREGLLVLKSYPTEVTPFGKLDVDWEKTKVWSEGGLLCPRLLQREGARAAGRDRAGRIRAVPRRRSRRSSRRRPTPREAAGHPRLQARADLPRVRNVAPDLIVHFGGALLAVDRRRRLSDDPRPRERHRTRRLQPCPVRRVRPGRAEQPAARRGDRRVCSTSRQPSWTWAATKSPASCKAGPWPPGSIRRLRRRRLRTRRRDHHPRPLERARLYRLISSRQSSVVSGQ